MTRLHTIGRRYRSASKYTFARPSEIIGVHLCTREPEVPSTRYERWNLGKRGTLARVVQDLSPAASILSLLPVPSRGDATRASHGSGKSGPPRRGKSNTKSRKSLHRFFWNRSYADRFIIILLDPFLWTKRNSPRTDVPKALRLTQTNKRLDSTFFHRYFVTLQRIILTRYATRILFSSRRDDR